MNFANRELREASHEICAASNLPLLLADMVVIPCLYRPLFPIHLHQWLEAWDSDWNEAQVIYVDQTHFRLHYKGWKSQHDATFSFSQADWHDFAARGTYIAVWRETPRTMDLLAINALPEKAFKVLDSVDNELKGTIRKTYTTRAGALMLQVHYRGWPPSFDEWLDVDSYRFYGRFLM